LTKTQAKLTCLIDLGVAKHVRMRELWIVVHALRIVMHASLIVVHAQQVLVLQLWY